MKNENTDKVISTILNVIPLAMSVAAVALLTLKQITADTGVIMLAIGMFCSTIEKMRSSKSNM